MQVRVEAASGGLSVGPNGVPFELDCRDGSALLELAGRRIRLRPLRWGEKLRLARHAELGPDFVDRQLLRLGLDEQAESALDEAERALLLALARWLNGLQAGRAGLPLDPLQLATVTLELCRALELGPLDLDGREALEVEALWQAARQAPAGQADSAVESAAAPLGLTAAVEAGLTRIVVLPDPPGQAGPAVEATAAASDPDRPAPESGPAAGSAEIPPSAEAVAPPGPEQRIGGRFRMVDPASLLGQRPATGATPSVGLVTSVRPLAEHLAGPAAEQGERLAPEPVPLESRPAPVWSDEFAPSRQEISPAPAPGVAALARPLQAGPLPGPALVAAPAETRQPPLPTVAVRPDAPSIVPRFERPAVEVARSDEPAPSAPGWAQAALAEASDEGSPPSSAGLFEREALFEALSERLEQAAAELGIEAWS